MISKVPADFVLVRVDSEFDDKLFIKGEEGDIELKIDTRFRPTHHSKICAEVLAPPDCLGGLDVIYEKYQGLPQGAIYRGHDFIERKVMQTPRKYRHDIRIPYMCGGYTPENQTLADTEIDILPRDVVYFHYNCLLDDWNFVGKDESGLVFRIPYAKIFCRVRDGKITMLNGYILASEVWDDDATDINEQSPIAHLPNLKMKVKMKGSLVTDIAEKPKFGILKLEHIGNGVGEDTRNIRPGELIMYTPSAKNWDTEKRYGFTNRIEGKDYYVLQQWDIIAVTLSQSEIDWYVDKFEGAGFGIEYLTIKPVGDYVLIAPEEIPQSKSEQVVFDPRATTQEFKPGQLFVLPETLKKTKRKGSISWGSGKILSVGENANVPIGSKAFFGKSAFYTYLETEDMCLVRSNDVYGWEVN